jgi:hypothetical protein
MIKPKRRKQKEGKGRQRFSRTLFPDLLLSLSHFLMVVRLQHVYLVDLSLEQLQRLAEARQVAAGPFPLFISAELDVLSFGVAESFGFGDEEAVGQKRAKDGRI